MATAHILAFERKEAANQRFFITAGFFTNREVIEIIRSNFPELHDRLPPKDVAGDDYPQGGTYGYDNTMSLSVLGLAYRSLRECVIDTVKSLSSTIATRKI